MENKLSKPSIPHIIHYCWFGGKEKPDSIMKYINGWKEILFDYQFVEWNEKNFSIKDAPLYVREAYSVHKYAFVSDYVRINALSQYGGVYLDTDIEVVKRFDEVLEGYDMVLGFESDRSLETAFMACNKDNLYIKNFCNTYQNRRFILDDGTYDMSVINQHFSNYMQRYGVDLDIEEYRIIEKYNIVIYPREYFAAFDVKNWHINPTTNTYTIHHMNASWSSNKRKLYFNTIKFIQRLFGYRGYDRIKKIYDSLRGRDEKNK